MPDPPCLGSSKLVDFKVFPLEGGWLVVVGLWVAEDGQLLVPDLTDVLAEGQEVLGPRNWLLELEQDIVIGDAGPEDELPWEEEILDFVALTETSALPRVESEVEEELPGLPAVEVVSGSQHQVGRYEGAAPLAELGHLPRLEGEGSDVAVELVVHVLFGDSEELVVADDHLVCYIPAFGGRDGRKVHLLFF